MWCEAVNETAPRSRHGRVRWNLEHTFTRWGGRVLVAGVVVIALAVARAPVARFAPVVYPESPAARLAIAAVTLALLFNVFFNYYHAVVAEPGSVAHLPKARQPAAVRRRHVGVSRIGVGDGEGYRHRGRTGARTRRR